MPKVSFFVCVAVTLTVVGASLAPHDAPRYLRLSAEETAADPCTMHPLSSSSLDTDSGSLQESETMSIGNTVFDVVDPGETDTMTIGDKVLTVSDVEDTMSIGNTKLKLSD
ncbi:hypothetical protein PHYSODRAFT_299240 [Phytophthora sojae]|uniref:RxLR effector protein n=1 Tax=Phytophthora sojae (strain P6497) TaxID=1094619 RepID=G4Z407_PHYSP|nr:hypothetical protein PHYSODRAFT_299240 [Phytophthora sojae]EGZ21559.1 hypothetical protein PHYSODRAFT_299240 [Phytophthora sojae]|eukprot:XP_009524276.1 hypothetical protein PHYSODRAFT_299240 [Phytophthora sojae]